MMIRTQDEQPQAFGHWLRTGRLPVFRDEHGIERKFNPWHDPDDGRFTFAGSGRHDGEGGGGTPDQAPGGSSRGAARANRDRPALRNARSVSRPVTAPDGRAAPSRFAEFIRGTGEGVSQTAKAAAEGIHAALTTDPRTTVSRTSK